MNAEIVSYSVDGAVAVIEFDDGKVNALSHAAIEQLGAALDRAERDEVRAVVLAGRPGCFSAGFDLSVMRANIDAALQLAKAGAHLAVRLFSFPAPVVLAVTGHALAMAAVLCLAADERVGADGEYKIGFNEVAIGLPLGEFAVEFARDRLSPRHLTRAVTHAEIYSPEGAVEAGFLDRVVDGSVVGEALDTATRLAENLDPAAYRETKRTMRARGLDRIRRSLADGLERPTRS
jgi:enoyl-CoA hydratase